MYNKDIDWKIDKSTGYAYFTDKYHPLATGNSGRVYLHRHNASIALGRWLRSSEQVHHMDNNKLNNDFSNLEILSAEAHGKLHSPTNNISKVCPICNKTFSVQASGIHRINCSYICARKGNEKISISKDELEALIWEFPYTKVASIIGSSDKGVVKKAKSLGCNMPPPYYHNKRN